MTPSFARYCKALIEAKANHSALFFPSAAARGIAASLPANHRSASIRANESIAFFRRLAGGQWLVRSSKERPQSQLEKSRENQFTIQT